MGRLPYLPKEALSEFLNRYEQAELNAYDDLSTVRQAQKAQNAPFISWSVERRD